MTEPTPTDRPPDLTIAASGNIVGVYICDECGAAVLQRSFDEIDRPLQHAAWHWGNRQDIARVS